jgi:alanine racemase
MSNPLRQVEQARAWVEVDTGAVRANYRTLRERMGPGPAIMPMVKADAYGLGALRVVGVLEPLDAWG